MKIALVGSAPSSMGLAPWGDPSWKIWGCSPGLYATAARVDAWFELHRWEPPVIGKPHLQRPWFSPEYVAWMAGLKCPVWMRAPVPEIPTSEAYPEQIMVEKFGNFFMTSSLSWMFAMAIDQILKAREDNPEHDASQDAIGLWGVDMAATEEYGYQRAGCQFFAQIALALHIAVDVPPESDLLRPMPGYGLNETSPFTIKMTARRNELTARWEQAKAQLKSAELHEAYMRGALEDHNYMVQTWHPSVSEAIPFNLAVLARSPYMPGLVERENDAIAQARRRAEITAEVHPQARE